MSYSFHTGRNADLGDRLWVAVNCSHGLEEANIQVIRWVLDEEDYVLFEYYPNEKEKYKLHRSRPESGYVGI